MKRKISTIFAIICLLVVVICYGAEFSAKEESSAYGDILRLHVVANSDSVYDQKTKLIVRDGVVGELEMLLYDCKNIHEALSVSLENREQIEKTANRILQENGSSMKAKVVIGKKYYPRKTYEGCVFPAGEYLSVRVLIGEGKGRNWWCVLFPRLDGVGETEHRRLVLSKGLGEDKAKKALEEEEKGSVEIFGNRVRLKMADLLLKGR